MERVCCLWLTRFCSVLPCVCSQKEWKSRKQRCMDLVDMVADGMDKKLKKMMVSACLH